ncbi:conserved hypothetical protein [Ricinus communis]|uniref:Uncharacterized protein n=1 Tax=Ricinus communis TaxID=3988 RepID=B9RPX0_RICCO|nr:conserved hypothetical protein [Ricinus communis]
MLKKVKEESVRPLSDVQEESAEKTKSRTSSTDETSNEEVKLDDAERSPDFIEKEREETERKSKPEADTHAVDLMLSNQQYCMELDPKSTIYVLLRDIPRKQKENLRKKIKLEMVKPRQDEEEQKGAKSTKVSKTTGQSKKA